MPAEGRLEITDNFWLNMGAEIVYNSPEQRKKAVERLQATIAWVFGVYSATSISGVVFADKDWNSNVLLLFGAAFFFLIIAYWLATMAAFFNPANFYGSAPASIRNAYLVDAKRGRILFTAAIIICSLGVLFYSLSVFYQFSGKSMFNCKEKTADTVIDKAPEARVKKLSKGAYALHILSKKNEWVMVNLICDSVKNKVNYSRPVEFTVQGNKQKELWLYIDSTGSSSLVFVYPVTQADNQYNLWITRTDTIGNGTELNTYKVKTTLN